MRKPITLLLAAIVLIALTGCRSTSHAATSASTACQVTTAQSASSSSDLVAVRAYSADRAAPAMAAAPDAGMCNVPCVLTMQHDAAHAAMTAAGLTPLCIPGCDLPGWTVYYQRPKAGALYSCEQVVELYYK